MYAIYAYIDPQNHMMTNIYNLSDLWLVGSTMTYDPE